jgi:5-methylcytosine-specific restriction enzyme A
MTWGFVRGQKYIRRDHIHARFGGQEQGGIITPAKYNVIFLTTGKRGADYGYDDVHYDDGRIDYFGEGQFGGMKLTRGNRALAEHAAKGKDLLYFTKTYPERTITYMGQFICAGWRRKEAKDGAGSERSAIIFELHPIENVLEAAETIEPPTDAIGELRRRAFEAASLSVVNGQSMRTIYQRSADVRAYVLARAQGDCEGCRQPAPFTRRDGSPYLEPHHLRRASDGGPDHPRFVIALCPNCHTRTHHGEDGAIYNAALLERMPQIEP